MISFHKIFYKDFSNITIKYWHIIELCIFLSTICTKLCVLLLATSSCVVVFCTSSFWQGCNKNCRYQYYIQVSLHFLRNNIQPKIHGKFIIHTILPKLHSNNWLYVRTSYKICCRKSIVLIREICASFNAFLVEISSYKN